MTPDRLHERLFDLHEDLEAITGNLPAIAANWTIIAGKLADLAQELKEAIPGQDYQVFRLLGAHVFGVLEGSVQVLDLVCNSDFDSETLNVIRLVDCAIAGLTHTLERHFLFDPETEVPAHD